MSKTRGGRTQWGPPIVTVIGLLAWPLASVAQVARVPSAATETAPAPPSPAPSVGSRLQPSAELIRKILVTEWSNLATAPDRVSKFTESVEQTGQQFLAIVTKDSNAALAPEDQAFLYRLAFSVMDPSSTTSKGAAASDVAASGAPMGAPPTASGPVTVSAPAQEQIKDVFGKLQRGLEQKLKTIAPSTSSDSIRTTLRKESENLLVQAIPEPLSFLRDPARTFMDSLVKSLSPADTGKGDAKSSSKPGQETTPTPPVPALGGDDDATPKSDGPKVPGAPDLPAKTKMPLAAVEQIQTKLVQSDDSYVAQYPKATPDQRKRYLQLVLDQALKDAVAIKDPTADDLDYFARYTDAIVDAKSVIEPIRDELTKALGTFDQQLLQKGVSGDDREAGLKALVMEWLQSVKNIKPDMLTPKDNDLINTLIGDYLNKAGGGGGGGGGTAGGKTVTIPGTLVQPQVVGGSTVPMVVGQRRWFHHYTYTSVPSGVVIIRP